MASEGQRRLNIIESRHDRYQRQSALLLRISLATVGVIAAFGDLNAILDFLKMLASNIDPSSTVQEISGAGTQETPLLATLQVFALSAQGLIGALLAMTFMLSTIVSAGLVVYPRGDGLPICLRNLDSYFEGNVDRPQECIRRHYDDLILLNTAALEETRSQLKLSFISVVGAISGSIIALTSVIVLAFAGPQLVQTAGVLSAGLLAMGLVTVFFVARANEKYRQVVSWSHETETGLLLALIVIALLLYVPAVGSLQIFGLPIIIFVPFLAPIRGLWRSESERMRIGFKGVAWHIILLSSLGGLIIVYPGDITTVVPSSIISVVFFSSFFPLGYMVELLAFSLLLLAMDLLQDRNPDVYHFIVSKIPQRLKVMF